MTKQLIGEPALHARPFQYCGSIGPLPDRPERPAGMAAEIGRAVAAQFNLRGLFGCDFIADGSTVWLAEVNPRYTASVEIYELAWGTPSLRWHLAACGTSADDAGACATALNAELMHAKRSDHVAAKAILYAPCDFVAPALSPFEFDARETHPLAPQLADIPRAGSYIAAGHPVCTVLASGPTEHDCRAASDERIERLSRKLFGA
jgi:predicted ATP-grasp superfamily ATP-dependent carboligase